MTISSMTGYGRSEGAFQDRSWYWELRSVNGRGLDLKFRLPPGFENVDQICRKRAQAVLSRGNVQCNLAITASEGKPSFQINQAALEQALSYMAAVAQHVETAPSAATDILAMPGVLERFSEERSTEEQATLNDALIASFEAALTALAQARLAEGEHLRSIIAGLLDQITELIQLATDNPARTPRAIQDRIKKQITLLSGGQTRLDEERLHQEAMLLAAKADIQEELDRLRAHIVAAGDLLLAGQPVGRKFDFLTQEFNREANTLCSKSNDPALTKTGLALKAVVDQLREQIQNIE